jgi:hypothetical protein
MYADGQTFTFYIQPFTLVVLPLCGFGPLRFYHRAHKGLHRVSLRVYVTRLLCALCVFVVFYSLRLSVLGVRFYHRVHKDLHGAHGGFSQRHLSPMSSSRLSALGVHINHRAHKGLHGSQRFLQYMQTGKLLHFTFKLLHWIFHTEDQRELV